MKLTQDEHILWMCSSLIQHRKIFSIPLNTNSLRKFSNFYVKLGIYLLFSVKVQRDGIIWLECDWNNFSDIVGMDSSQQNTRCPVKKNYTFIWPIKIGWLPLYSEIFDPELYFLCSQSERNEKPNLEFTCKLFFILLVFILGSPLNNQTKLKKIFSRDTIDR